MVTVCELFTLLGYTNNLVSLYGISSDHLTAHIAMEECNICSIDLNQWLFP